MRFTGWILAAALLGTAAMGCAIEGADELAPEDIEAQIVDELDDARQAPTEDVALDAAHGEEEVMNDAFGAAAVANDDRGGPDPTPWETGAPEGPDPTPWEEGAAGDAVAGPDPTPWRQGNDDDLNVAGDLEPDPTPWQQSHWGSAEQPWVVGKASQDHGRPDQTARGSSGNKDD